MQRRYTKLPVAPHPCALATLRFALEAGPETKFSAAELAARGLKNAACGNRLLGFLRLVGGNPARLALEFVDAREEPRELARLIGERFRARYKEVAERSDKCGDDGCALPEVIERLGDAGWTEERVRTEADSLPSVRGATVQDQSNMRGCLAALHTVIKSARECETLGELLAKLPNPEKVSPTDSAPEEGRRSPGSVDAGQNSGRSFSVEIIWPDREATARVAVPLDDAEVRKQILESIRELTERRGAHRD